MVGEHGLSAANPAQVPLEILLQGLGKTLQCAAFLAGLIESRLIRRAIGERACWRLGCILKQHEHAVGWAAY